MYKGLRRSLKNQPSGDSWLCCFDWQSIYKVNFPWTKVLYKV